jgi:hypothetical protein
MRLYYVGGINTGTVETMQCPRGRGVSPSKAQPVPDAL